MELWIWILVLLQIVQFLPITGEDVLGKTMLDPVATNLKMGELQAKLSAVENLLLKAGLVNREKTSDIIDGKRVCKDGWKMIEGSCYLVPCEKMTHKGAFKVCKVLGARLAKIHNVTMLQTLIREFSGYEGLIVGGRRFTDTRFYWEDPICLEQPSWDNCERLDNELWNVHQPDRTLQPYVTMLWSAGYNVGYLHDIDYEDAYNFLCQYHLEPVFTP